MDRAADLVARFTRLNGYSPSGVWAAPGRVNLMGEHTDYNSGWVLPFAVDRWALVAAGGRRDRLVTCRSLDFPGTAAVALDDLGADTVEGWALYALGPAWVLQQEGVDLPGVDVLVSSDVPPGAGLASSAALGVCVTIALADLAGMDLEPLDLAVVARRAENDFAGAPVGLMDHAAALLCQEGCALLLDCRSLDHEPIPLDGLAEHGMSFVVIDTGVRHAHASGEYAHRRRACEKAAFRLGVDSLRDADGSRLDEIGDPDLEHFARHVVTENERVLRTVAALQSGSAYELSALFAASHASLRDDFRVSCAELDAAVEAALEGGAVAARMTGGGFGGCAVAIAPAASSEAIRKSVGAEFAGHDWKTPRILDVRPVGGAGRLL